VANRVLNVRKITYGSINLKQYLTFTNVSVHRHQSMMFSLFSKETPQIP